MSLMDVKKISFYTELKRDEFRNMLEREIQKLENLNMEFVIFKDPNLIIPKMSFDGYVTVGLNNIKNELNEHILKK